MSEPENVGYDITLPAANIYEVPCPILRALEVIGGKWKLPLLWHLADGAVRFNALHREVRDITHMMLSKCLKELEGDGLLRRVIESGKIPNMVFYGPSGTGKTTVANIIADRSGRALRRLNATTPPWPTSGT